MEKGFVYIHNCVFQTLLAISSEEQSLGLMHQAWPPPAMSFVYGSPQVNKFWMKNTPSPLDIVFCHDGRVSEICEGKPYSTSVIGSDKLSDLVIELPYGTINSSEIKIGHDVGLIKPTISEIRKIIAEKTLHFVKF
jgi:uncharacterized membrane protein (UPF0127 family)